MEELTADTGLAGAVELIQKDARKAVSAVDRVHFRRIDELNQIAILVNDRELERIDIPQTWSSKLHSVDQIPDAVAAFSVKQIHIDGLKVVLLLKMSDIRHRVTVDLIPTAQWERLNSLAGETFDARGLQRMLRLEFGDCIDSEGERLIQWLSKVEFRNGETVRTESKRDRESLGRSVEAEVASEYGEMPSVISVAPRVYTDRALIANRSIPLQVDFQPLHAKFQLVPMPNSLEDNAAEELRDLQTLICNSLGEAHEDLPVLFGSV